MAEVKKRIMIKLTKQEKDFLDNLLEPLYGIETQDDIIGGIFSDIYDSYQPKGNDLLSTWEGTYADIIIKND